MRLFSTFHQYLKSQPENSLLTNQESVAMKGLLILLVILGHNTYLMTDMYAYRFLYAFHVYAFLYLPFLYNHRKEKISRCIVKNLIRFYIPYSFVFLILIVIYLKTAQNVDYMNIFLSYISGSTHRFLGFGGFLWFVPTMFSLLIIKQLFYRANTICRYLLLSISFFCLICFSFGYLGIWQIYQPFRCMTAMAMLLPAVVSRYFIESNKVVLTNLYFLFVVIIAFIIYPGNYYYEYTILNRFILPVFMFLFLYNQRKSLVSLKYLMQIGKNSFPIYIFHIFIYQCFYWLIDKYMGGGTLYWGIIIYILTIVISYTISKIKVVQLLFPH